MLFHHYYETVLEQWISGQYISNKIMVPTDLEIGRISDLFGVDLGYDTCKSFSDNEEGVIILNKRLALVPARMIFFHELCHVLRHVGDQRKMPELFKDAQEAEASAFMLYASMPYYMISKLSLPSKQNDAIEYLASVFQVPIKTAKQRLEQIQRRELQGLMMAAVKKSKAAPQIIPEKTPESKVYAYYDPSGEFDAPSQIIVCVDEETLVKQDEIIFNPDGPFERIDEENQLEMFKGCRQVFLDDMDLVDGMIHLKVSYLAFSSSSSSYMFVIQRKDLEKVLEFHGAYF